MRFRRTMPRHHGRLLCAFPALSTVLLAFSGEPPVYVTQWGSFGSGDGQFNYPGGVATDAEGNVYVADRYNYRIQKFTSDGTYLTQWGTFGTGNGQFHEADDVATDAFGHVYVADANSRRIQKFTSDGTYLTQWNSAVGAADVATDAAGNVFVSGAFGVEKYTSTGTLLTQWGSGGFGNGEFQYADGVGTDSAGNVYVADTYNDRIQKFAGDGTYLTQWGTSGSGNGQFDRPYSVAVDLSGTVYVADLDNHRIQAFTSDGAYVMQWGTLGSGNGQFQYPGEVAVDAAGDIFVGDINNSRIQKFGPAPTPCYTLDFQSEDDLVTPLGNGQSLGTPTDFGLLVSISSAGSNLGVTTFDSTPGGPNGGTADADMLIDRGNILMLQDSAHAAQTVPGFFDTPVDDPDGGDLIFDFTAPSSPRSVVLIDLDPEPNQGASVILTDVEGKSRTYTVQPGWTGSYGSTAGWKELDLTTLADQVGNAPGFRKAKATETPGYDPERVRRMVVHMTGMGAMDDLSVCSSSLALASTRTRIGSGINPSNLSAASEPVLGRNWTANLDCSGYGHGVATLMVRSLPTAGTTSPLGETLITGDLLGKAARSFSGSVSPFKWFIPYDMSLCGLQVHAQGLCRSASSSVPGKTMPFQGGLSNALDLVLGF